MAQCDISCMVGAEAATVRDGAFVTVLTLHKRKDFVEDVVFKLNMTKHSVCGMLPAAVKAVVVNAVDAVEL